MKQCIYSLNGYLNKYIYKISVFESEINFIIFGFVLNIIFLSYLVKNGKISFYLFDILLGPRTNNINDYIFLLEYFFLRKFIKYFIKYIFEFDEKYKSKEKSNIKAKKNRKLFIFLLVCLL